MREEKIACLLLVIIVFFSFCITKKAEVKIEERKIDTASQSSNIEAPAGETKEEVKEEAGAEQSFSIEKDITPLCISCHGNGDIAFVKSFHYPAKIMKIDEEKGIKPRICITCHGQKVHEVHRIKLEKGDIICDTCHKIKGEIIKPEAKEGMLLVCELCHAKGNYIEIHIGGNILKYAPIDEKWKKSYELNNTCKICHFGKLSFIHKNVLERWKEKINNISIGKVEPLNISYL